MAMHMTGTRASGSQRGSSCSRRRRSSRGAATSSHGDGRAAVGSDRQGVSHPASVLSPIAAIDGDCHCHANR